MGLRWEHCREGKKTTVSGPKLKSQRYCHVTKDAAAKQRTQTQTPRMQGHDDIPQPEKEQKLQEVEEPHDGGIRQGESFPGLGEGSCMTESHRRWRSIPRNWRLHQILSSPPFQRQKRDRRHRQDPDNKGGKGEQMCGRQG